MNGLLKTKTAVVKYATQKCTRAKHDIENYNDYMHNTEITGYTKHDTHLTLPYVLLQIMHLLLVGHHLLLSCAGGLLEFTLSVYRHERTEKRQSHWLKNTSTECPSLASHTLVHLLSTDLENRISDSAQHITDTGIYTYTHLWHATLRCIWCPGTWTYL